MAVQPDSLPIREAVRQLHLAIVISSLRRNAEPGLKDVLDRMLDSLIARNELQKSFAYCEEFAQHLQNSGRDILTVRFTEELEAEICRTAKDQRSPGPRRYERTDDLLHNAAWKISTTALEESAAGAAKFLPQVADRPERLARQWIYEAEGYERWEEAKKSLLQHADLFPRLNGIRQLLQKSLDDLQSLQEPSPSWVLFPGWSNQATDEWTIIAGIVPSLQQAKTSLDEIERWTETKPDRLPVNRIHLLIDIIDSHYKRPDAPILDLINIGRQCHGRTGLKGREFWSEIDSRLKDVKDEVESTAENRLGDVARLMISLAIVELLDDYASDLQKEWWGKLELRLRRMNKSLDRTLYLIREKVFGRDTFEVERFEHPDRFVRRSGLAIGDSSKPKVVIRKAEFQEVPSPDPIEQALRKLGEAHDADCLLLAADCRVFSAELRQFRTFADWLRAKSRDHEAIARLWELQLKLHLASAAVKDAACAAIEAFRGAGVRWVDVATRPADSAARPGWTFFIAPRSDRAAQAPIFSGIAPRALETELETYYPAYWLEVPYEIARKRPLLGQVHDQALPLERRLRLKYGNWDGWDAWDNFIDRLIHASDPAADSDARVAIAELLRRLYLAANSDEPTFRREFRPLFISIYKSVKSETRPRFREDTGEPQNVTAEDLDKLDIEWRAREEPAGAVLEVTQFGYGPSKAKVVCSTGPADHRSWLLLPRLRDEQDPDVAELRKLDTRIQKAALNPKPAEAVSAVLQDFAVKQRQVVSKANWLNDVMHRVLHQKHAEGTVTKLAPWLEKIHQDDILPCFPWIDITSRRVIFHGKPERNPNLEWAFHESIPKRHLIGERVLFHLEPGRAEGKFSLGLRSPTSPVVLTETMLESAGPDWIERPILKRLVADLRWQSILWDLGAGEPEDAAVELGGWLDQLTQEAYETAEPNEVHERCFNGLSAWAQSCGLRFQPATWPSFSSPTPFSADDGLPAAFSSDQPRGRTVVRQFGVADQTGGEFRPTEMYVSAGPGPRGFDEFLALVDAHRSAIGQWFAEILRALPFQSLLDDVEPELIFRRRIHPAFWQRADEIRNSEEVSEEQASLELLRGQFTDYLLDAFGYTVFFPAMLDEFPDHWIEVQGTNASMSSAIRRVITPGLHDSGNQLIERAVVELK